MATSLVLYTYEIEALPLPDCAAAGLRLNTRQGFWGKKTSTLHSQVHSDIGKQLSLPFTCIVAMAQDYASLLNL